MTIIIAHPSWPWQDEALSVCLHKPNVYIDLSGWSPKYFPPQLVQYANTQLRTKMLFGSDYPLITPDRWIKDFSEAGFKPEVHDLILKQNAVRALGLTPEMGRSGVIGLPAVGNVVKLACIEEKLEIRVRSPSVTPGYTLHPHLQEPCLKPYIICHMASSIDGRILPSRWRPQGIEGHLYERLHTEFAAQAWLIGRVTGQEFAKAKEYANCTTARFPREPWFVRRDATSYAVVLDAQGKIAWGRSDIGGDPIVVVLTKGVSDAHLAGLRSDNVSYVFAGETRIDLDCALEILNEELGVQRLLLEGGGVVNGSFLRAGLVDEISLIVWPVVDGAAGAPCVFDSTSKDASRPAPVRAMQLMSSESMADGAVWLRYRLENG